MRARLPGGARHDLMAGAEPISLGLQFGASALLVLLMTVVHGLGLGGISRWLHLSDDRLEKQDFNRHAILKMGAIALSLFVLHLLEIWLFAGFYMAVGAIDSLEEAIYFSASTYATLGRTEEFFPVDWRIVGSMEALIGFLLIGWSTAFIVSRVNKLRE
jgi:hypothetical protein